MDLLKMLKEAEKRKAELLENIKNAATAQELDNIELDLRKVEIEIKDLQEKIAANDGEDPSRRSLDDDVPMGGLDPLKTYRGVNTNTNSEADDEDMYSSLEYRKAFRNFVVSGTPIPEKFVQKRANELTVVSDIGAVIPTTILNKVIEDLTSEGKIINRINLTQYQGGVAIPISEINPTATWLESENETSDEQKAKMSAKLTFSYNLLEARIAIGLLSATVSLPIFEQTVVKQLKKAMIKAIEKAVISGTGAGQPLGITKYSNLPTDQVIEFDEGQVESVKGWARPEAAVPEAYEDGVIYLMSKQTWEMHLNSMTDSNGQKIGLGKINEKGQKILNGREVLCTDQLPSFEKAADGDIFGVLVNLEEYCLNSNLAMAYKKYFDEDKNKYVHKAIMIADGKMPIGTASDGTTLVGAKGLIYLKKKATS